MGRNIIGCFCVAILLTSCMTASKVITNLTHSEKQMVDDAIVPLPQDSTKRIVVYNVVEKENKKAFISDETIRLFIADLFGTITTLVTLRHLEETP